MNAVDYPAYADDEYWSRVHAQTPAVLQPLKTTPAPTPEVLPWDITWPLLTGVQALLARFRALRART